MKHISITSFKEVLGTEKNNTAVDFINVCTTAEYKEKHIPGVRSVPLDELNKHVSEFNGKQTIYVHCRSGNRSKKAIEQLESLGVRAELVNVEGGILAWDAAGFATNSHTNRLPIIRQVLIAAGSLVVISHIAAAFVPVWLYLSLFVGVGLLFAGVTGWCGMAFLLAKMPWNK